MFILNINEERKGGKKKGKKKRRKKNDKTEGITPENYDIEEEANGEKKMARRP